MLETTKNLVNEINELMDMCIRQIGISGVTNMSQTDFDCLHKTIRVIDGINKVIVEEAEMMENQNEKLNRILDILEKDAR